MIPGIFDFDAIRKRIDELGIGKPTVEPENTWTHNDPHDLDEEPVDLGYDYGDCG